MNSKGQTVAAHPAASCGVPCLKIKVYPPDKIINRGLND